MPKTRLEQEYQEIVNKITKFRQNYEEIIEREPNHTMKAEIYHDTMSAIEQLNVDAERIMQKMKLLDTFGDAVDVDPDF